VTSRYGSIDFGGKRMAGLNNIELISDRALDVNLREIEAVKKDFPDHAVVTSLMVETKKDWEEIIKACEEAGSDGHELNFGCPHGMCERGMGSAVGQEPKLLEEITRWAKSFAKKPVLVKLTPNISDIVEPAQAAKKGGADGVSLINTIKSLMGVDLDKMVPLPVVGMRSSNGGYCGPAVKPIALHMVAQIARDPVTAGFPISGIGGIGNWRDAAEFIALGSTSVQVCTAVMHHGFRIVEDMIEGLETFMDEKGYKTIAQLAGRAVPSFVEWGDLDLSYKIIASIDSKKCIGCELCYIACWDGAHQCIAKASGPDEHGIKIPRILEDQCTGCNLCSLVCPVDGCITMRRVDDGKNPVTWNDYVRSGGKIKLPPAPVAHANG
jgi:dihydropyrimidine dehydrogenase (NAD+) subunit PreA